MNTTNIECICNSQPSVWGIGPATNARRAISGTSEDESARTAPSGFELYGVDSHTECSMASVKVPHAQSYGGVLFSIDGRVLLRQPIDHLDGYVWTWPKGKPEKGENPLQTALREVYEETGYRAHIIRVLPRAYVGTTRTTAFFLMEPVGEQGSIINETAQTRWVSYEEACSLIELNKHAIGRNRDRAILDDAFALWLTANLAKNAQLSASVSFQFIRL